jgi:hypothetical protein
MICAEPFFSKSLASPPTTLTENPLCVAATASAKAEAYSLSSVTSANRIIFFMTHIIHYFPFCVNISIIINQENLTSLLTL